VANIVVEVIEESFVDSPFSVCFVILVCDGGNGVRAYDVVKEVHTKSTEHRAWLLSVDDSSFNCAIHHGYLTIKNGNLILIQSIESVEHIEVGIADIVCCLSHSNDDIVLLLE